MEQRDVICALLPDVYSQQIKGIDWYGLEEIRMGSDRPLRLQYHCGEREIWPVSKESDMDTVLQRACGHSIYAHAKSIGRGFVTVEGGHRIGICGYGVPAGDGIQTLVAPSSLNIRVAHEVPGCAQKLHPYLKQSTLLLGPPGSGKTTLLRDAIRLLSDREKVVVGLADERGELSAAVRGTSQLNVGSRTDVLVNVPKAQAVMMLLRTMNPAWIALDEITAEEDMLAIEQAAYCGVKLLATAHGADLSDLERRPLYRKLMETAVFQQVVVLNRDKSYTIKEVLV